MKGFGPLMQQGKFEEAEGVLDRALALLGAGTTQKPPTSAQHLTQANSVTLGRIPPEAEIIYHASGELYVTDRLGAHGTQITHEHPRHWEHVAVSYDHRRVVANEWSRPWEGGLSSRLWVFDLEKGTETPLLSQFKMAGNGGVSFGPDGYIYFAAIEKDLFPKPRRREEFIANIAANDVYRAKHDGSGLQRLTNTTDRGEADVSVSKDGTLITYAATKIDPLNSNTEVWLMNSDGTNARVVYVGGRDRVSSVHDPEVSPDNKKIVFSRVNPNFKNFPSDPNANTAHDLYTINVNGTGLTRITPPGPISIIPDWRGELIVYLEMTDREKPPFLGLSLIRPDGTGRKRIRPNASTGRWIP